VDRSPDCSGVIASASPYEPRVIGGKLLMPAELQAIHRHVVETPVLDAVTEEGQ